MKRWKKKRIGPNFLYIIQCLFNMLCNCLTNWRILNLCNLSGKSIQTIVDTIVWLTYNEDPVCLWQENFKNWSELKTYFHGRCFLLDLWPRKMWSNVWESGAHQQQHLQRKGESEVRILKWSIQSSGLLNHKSPKETVIKSVYCSRVWLFLFQMLSYHALFYLV